MNRSLLFIPDISGFTEFVSSTEVAHSQHIIAELLELIIDSDQLGLTVSEVEGDAVLFYKRGDTPPLEAIVRQAELTFQAFHTHLKRYDTHRICNCGACRTAHHLSLKVVAHAGPVELISVKGFEKPYGSDVILAHRLLKNGIEEAEYLLLTEPLINGTRPGPSTESEWPDWVSFVDGAATYDTLGHVDFQYVPLSPLLSRLPDPPPPSLPEKTRNPIVATGHIECPPPKVFDLISNFDKRLRWNPDVDEIEYEEGRVNRVGTHHRCVIDGQLIDFETVTNDFGEGRMVYGETIEDPPLVESVTCYYVLEPEGSGTRLRVEAHYKPKPFPRSLAAPLFRFGFGRRLPGIVRAIKKSAESHGAPLEGTIA